MYNNLIWQEQRPYKDYQSYHEFYTYILQV